MAVSEMTIDKVKAYTYQRTYLYEVVLPRIGSIPPEQIEPLIQECTYGDYEMDDGEVVRFGARQSNFAGFFSIKEVSLTFRETESHIVWQYFNQWRELIVSQTGHFGNKLGDNGYAFPIVVNYLSGTGDITKTITLKNAFPKRVEQAQLSYAQSKVLSYEIPFKVDKIDVVVNGAPQSVLTPGQPSTKTPTGIGIPDIIKKTQTVLGSPFPTLPSNLPGETVIRQRSRQLMDIYNKAKVLQGAGKNVGSSAKTFGRQKVREIARRYGVPSPY